MLFRFLDNPHVEVDSRREMLASTKSVALLVYLACQQTWVTRDTLSALFSDDNTDSDALRQLRVILSRARKFGWVGALELEDNRLRFKVQTDLQLFRQAIGTADWQRATELYRSEFLSGFQIRASGFEAWLEVERETLRQAWLEAALLHSRTLAAQNDHLAASHLLQNILALDALSEDVLALYLEQQYLAGGRSEALKAFERFRDQLQNELALEPLESTLKLVQVIRQAAPLETTSIASVGRSSVPLTVLRPPQLIGRDTERTTLETASQTVMLVSGEPGSGKTRLLEEVLGRRRWLACFEGLENVPYQPLIVFLRSQLSTLPDLGVYSEDLARLIPEVLPNPSLRTDDPISAKARLLEALARCFEAEAKPIVIDDLQWADASSLEFLSFLALRGVVNIFGTYRSSEINPALGKTIAAWRSNGMLLEVKLEPLTMNEINSLLASLSGLEAGPQRFSSWLSKQSGGNPFFALETLKALFETEMLHEKDGTWTSQLDDLSLDYNELRVPSRVAAVIEQRVSRLSEPAKRALQAACVMRQGFTPKTLAGIVGLSEFAVLDALEEAQNSSLIAGDHFVHDLIRQGMYQNLPEARRKVLHGNVAQMLEHVGEPMVVAEHWLSAGDTSQAIPKLRQAADLYQQRGLHSEAIKVLHSAIELMPHDTLKLETQVRLATVLYEVDRFEDAQKLVNLILPNAQNPLLRLKLFNLQVDIFTREDRIPEALATLQEAVSLTSTLSPNELDQNARTIKGKLAFLEGNLEHALEIYETELEHLRHNSRSLEFADALSDVGTIYERLGDFEGSLRLYQESFDIAKALGARHIQVGTACGILMAHMNLGHSENGIQLGEEMLSLGWYRDSDTLRNNLVAAHNFLGQHDEVMRHSEIMARESPDPRFRAAAWSRMARIYPASERTKIENALEHALEILELVFDHAAVASVGLNVVSLGTETQRTRAFQHLERVNTQMVSQNLQERLGQAFASRTPT